MGKFLGLRCNKRKATSTSKHLRRHPRAPNPVSASYCNRIGPILHKGLRLQVQLFPLFPFCANPCCFSGGGSEAVLDPLPFCFGHYRYLLKIDSHRKKYSFYFIFIISCERKTCSLLGQKASALTLN